MVQCILPNRKVPPFLDYSDDIGAGFGDYHYKPRIDRGAIGVDERHYFEYSLHLPIREMSIQGKWFTDSDVDDLVSLDSLSVLRLDGTSISSNGIERLKKLRQLSSLIIDNQVFVSPSQPPK